MPVPFAALPDERAGFGVFLDEQRRAILSKLEGLSDEQAATRATVSDFCMLTLVRHVAFDEVSPGSGLNRRWVLLHLMEELARHVGHADIIRESIDGQRGT